MANTKQVEPTETNEELERLKNLTFASADKENIEEEEKDVMKRAMKLERVIITCNNKNKTSYTGEIFCARNDFVPEVKKFVPFGVPTHVPHILMSMIREKKYQTFTKKKVNGNTITESMLINEYNIQPLDPITPEELEAIKQKQLAEGKD